MRAESNNAQQQLKYGNDEHRHRCSFNFLELPAADTHLAFLALGARRLGRLNVKGCYFTGHVAEGNNVAAAARCCLWLGSVRTTGS